MDILIEGAFRGLIKKGSLTIVTASGKRLSLGDGGGESVTLRFLDRRAQLLFLWDSEMRFGELFTDGRIVMDEGTVFDALNLILRESQGAKTPFLLRWILYFRFQIRKLKQRNSMRASRRNIAHHYDIDERIYALFLDEDWQYSCAYFEEATMSLEVAQLAKKRHIAAKLLINGGERVLEIGCGWGGLACYLAETAGAGHVTGISLSVKQTERARQRAVARKLDDKVTFNLQDYRKQVGRFDRIASIAMFEAVGVDFYDEFFRSCSDQLTEDGVMLLHTIGNLNEPTYTNPWLVKYIFPGGHLPSLSEILPSIERAGFIVTDIEILRSHYAKTLHEWRRRFLARREEAAKIYDERFCRMWEFYLSMAETGFLWENVAVFQIQIARSQTTVPITRNYLEKAEAGLKKAEASRPSTR